MSLHTLSDLTGDFVIYRNLQPFDPRLPGLREAWREMGVDSPRLVRKREPGYALVAAWLLRRCHELHAPGVIPSELLLLGDTVGNDGGAFRALAETTGWRGSAFIGGEEQNRSALGQWQGDLYIANRWQMLGEWLTLLAARDLALDERTLVIVDIDKTVLGARGRNNVPIDKTRLVGMQTTIRDALGPASDLAAFTAIYNELNEPEYKDLTSDNQDYLAYACMMVGAGIYPIDDLRRAYTSGQVTDFSTFISHIQADADSLPPRLAGIHRTVYDAFMAGDPTPFKEFRRNEYRAAVASMGNLPDDAPLSERLQHEICLTREVWDVCEWLSQRGALITALSDKPDEACAPTPELAAQGFQPIHRTPTHIVGVPLSLAA